MKTTGSPIQAEMLKVVAKVRDYWQARLEGENISALNETIRELRILLQVILTDSFLSLPLPKAKEFRLALGDQLGSLCKELSPRCASSELNHHHYCTQEILACFEWAEQIKEEIPDDVLTQRVLVIDIPILRPFHYGYPKMKPIRRPR